LSRRWSASRSRLTALACGVLVTSASSPVRLQHPSAVEQGKTPPPPSAPTYSIDFDLGKSYQPGSLRVRLNGQDITQRFGARGSAPVGPNDLRGTTGTNDYVQTLSWTASCIRGARSCVDANATVTFLAWGLGFTCSPLAYDLMTSTNGRFVLATYAKLATPNCMSPNYSLGLNRRTAHSGTVTVELGAPAPAGGLVVQIVPEPDPTKPWLIVNGRPPLAPSTVNVPASTQRASFEVTLLPDKLPPVTIPATTLMTTILLKAGGFPPTFVPVRIAP
jgi:hypothetical protein